jgi:DNA-binding CsgD family transcriptional regulator
MPFRERTTKIWMVNRVKNDTLQSEQDEDLIVECVRLLEQLYPEKVILLCQKHHTIFKCAGGNSVDLWGYTKDMLESFSLEKLIAIVHPEDIDNVMWGLSKLQEFSEDAQEDMKSVFTYRVRTLSGQYIRVCDEKVCVRTSRGTYAYFNIYSRSSDQTIPVRLEIYKRIAGKRMLKVNEFVFGDRASTFSSRELQIIRLLDKGLDNQALAETLSLSIYTVKNHKQKIFKKANVKNSLELIRYARVMNLI